MNAKNGNGWRSIIIAFLVPLLLAAVAGGILRGSVIENRRDIERHEVLFQRIDNKLDRILERQ